MPNQLNYPKKLTSTYFQRPDRLTEDDLSIIQTRTQQVLYGTNAKDVVETWVYNSNGSIAGHVNIFPHDESLSLTTLIDQTGPIEYLNINLVDALQKMDIQSGRYAMVINFFRDEVGSESGYKLYISDISDDRTELQIYPVAISGDVVRDLYEFVTPSVTKRYANALIDQFFNKSLDAQPHEIISWDGFRAQLDRAVPNTMTKTAYAGRTRSLNDIYDVIIERAYKLALDKMADDILNLYVQQVEIEAYIESAVSEVIVSMKQSGELDPHFELI